MRRRNRKDKYTFGRYLIELSVIVLGIMLSFLLNDWREKKQQRQDEIIALKEIQKDLLADSLRLEGKIKDYKSFIHSMNALINYSEEIGGEHADSLAYFLDNAVSYGTFDARTIGYTKLVANNNLALISNDSLLENIINLYNSAYASIEEWNAIERKFVLEQMIPFLNENAPYSTTALPYLYPGDIVPELKKNSHFMHLLNNGRIFKMANLSVYQANVGNVSYVKKQIDSAISELEE